MARKREAGQALFIAVLLLTVLMLAAGLAIDMGYLRLQKRRMQSAADSAAIAGADELAYNATNYMVAAKNDAAANGFTDTSLGGTATVTVSSPPVDGPYAGTANYVEVAITQSQPTFFMKAVGTNSESVSTLAVAGLRAGPSCIYALGPGGVNLTGGTTSFESNTTATDCSVTDDGPMTLEYASVDHLRAITVGVDGSCTISDGGSCSGSTNVTPNPVQIVPSSDPLSYLTAPGSAGGCSGPPLVVSSGTVNGSSNCGIIVSGGSVTFNPGTYYGIQITGNATVNFSGGTYILGSTSGNTGGNSPIVAQNPTCNPGSGTTPAGTGSSAGLCPSLSALLITGNSNNISGTGVTFYNSSGSILLCTAYNDGSGDDGTGCQDWGGATNMTLSAPTSGTDSGILFYQSSGNTAPAIIAGNDDIYGQNTTSMEGAFYFPAAILNLYDLSDSGNAYTILDAYQLNLLGKINIGLGSDYASLSPPPVRDAYLTE